MGGDTLLAQVQLNQCVDLGEITCCEDGSGSGQGSGADGSVCYRALLGMRIKDDVGPYGT
jgi:hypothetical protein